MYRLLCPLSLRSAPSQPTSLWVSVYLRIFFGVFTDDTTSLRIYVHFPTHNPLTSDRTRSLLRPRRLSADIVSSLSSGPSFKIFPTLRRAGRPPKNRSRLPSLTSGRGIVLSESSLYLARRWYAVRPRPGQCSR